MADTTAGKTEPQKSVPEPREVTFICQRCNRTWNINEMRRVTRFRPVLIVCPECEKEFR